MYEIETRALKQAVRRNINRFPSDFMFDLSKDEMASLRSQFVTLKRGQHSKYKSMAFTEHGVAMLSSVLNNGKAVELNIAIIRVFVRIRELLFMDKEFASKVERLENQLNVQGKSLNQVILFINKFLNQPKKNKRQIGFKIEKSSHNFCFNNFNQFKNISQ